jgi:hypothetical protein
MMLMATACDFSGEVTNDTPDSVQVIVQDTITHSDTVVIIPIQKEKTFGSSINDKYYLNLYEKIPIGFTFARVVNNVNGIADLHPEDNNDALGEKGLTEATKNITFIGYPAKLECNFSHDTLYRYSIVFNEMNGNKASSVYEKLIDYYSNNLGDAIMVSNEEDNHYTKIYYWKLNPDYILVAYNLNSGNITIAVQSNKPGVIR